MESNICRVCGKDDFTAVSIFDEEDNMRYSSKVMQCVNIEISEDDDLPKLICIHCVSELSTSYKFIKKCENTNRVLRSQCGEQPPALAQRPEQQIKLEIKIEKDLSNYEDDVVMFDESNIYEEHANISKQKLKHNKPHKKRNNSKMDPIQCAVCGLLVGSQSAMEIHVRTHTGEKPYNCAFCEASYPAKGSLKRHIETFHMQRERKFTCEICGSSFYRKNDIMTHMRRHTGERPHVCPFCPKRFLQVASLIRHKRTHTGNKPYSCSVCTKNFADKSILSKHMTVHSNEKKYTCQLCNKAMKTKDSLRTHTALHKNEKLNICNFCGTAFSMKGNLKAHIMRVHSEKSGQCSVCMRTFSDLEVHMRKHTGETPFGCGECSKSFSSKRSLTNHIQFKHSSVGKYKCSMGDCERSFPIGTMLEFHLLKHHSHHTPHVCPQCARGFFRTSDLSRHLRVSHAHSQPLQQRLKPKLPLKTDSTA